jgi:hypothetical protein
MCGTFAKKPYGAIHVVCTGPCEQIELAQPFHLAVATEV